MTDHGNMFGAVEFYREAMSNGIKPIIGCEIYVAPTSRFEKKGVDKGPEGIQQPSDSPGDEQRGLSQSLQAGFPRLHGRLLLQAAHRQGDAAGAQRRSDRA